MRLRVWRDRNELTLADLAELINVKTRMTVSRYERGLRFPPPAVMQRIVRVTKGEVTEADFYADLPDPKPARKKARSEAAA